MRQVFNPGVWMRTLEVTLPTEIFNSAGQSHLATYAIHFDSLLPELCGHHNMMVNKDKPVFHLTVQIV